MTIRLPVLLPLVAALSVALSCPTAAVASDSADDSASASAGFDAGSATELDRIDVVGESPPRQYRGKNSRSGTRTNTPVRDIPQSISVITQDQIQDQAVHSMADAVRYVPGMGFAQGEGNRDTPIFRGNASTADFFIDGMRDDVQYFRDVYNIDRVEVLKGPNAMIFGRGGSGGVLNRVSKAANWDEIRDFGLQAGSYGRKRGTADVGTALNEAAALRVTAMAEDSDSYRDGVELQRYGINPTLSFRLGENTLATVGYEHFYDERTADRGIPSRNGVPFRTNASTFFGNADLSYADAKVNAVNALIDHDFGNGVNLRNRLRYADYDKFYQNVYANGAVTAAGLVAIASYNNATERENLLNQTDLTFTTQTGAIQHEWLAGIELGRQDTLNLRKSGNPGYLVPAERPLLVQPISFAINGTSDANNDGRADVAAVYIQDQIEFSPQWLAIVGLRYDHFKVDFTDRRQAGTVREIKSSDGLLSPRVGLVYKPIEDLSLYASYSIAHQPRAGEQLSSLSLNTDTVEPEEFENYEVGAKWELNSKLSVNAAFYRLDRSNVAVTVPDSNDRAELVDGQRVSGFEVELVGAITDAWRVVGGYAYADAELTRDTTLGRAGKALPQVPMHSVSLWNRVDLNDQWGFGLGAIYRGESFTTIDNSVRLPSYTRVDAAVYYTLNSNIQFQLNAENLLDETYYPNAHNNNNITPGSPRAAWLSVSLRY